MTTAVTELKAMLAHLGSFGSPELDAQVVLCRHHLYSIENATARNRPSIEEMYRPKFVELLRMLEHRPR